MKAPIIVLLLRTVAATKEQAPWMAKITPANADPREKNPSAPTPAGVYPQVAYVSAGVFPQAACAPAGVYPQVNVVVGRRSRREYSRRRPFGGVAVVKGGYDKTNGDLPEVRLER